MKDIEEYAGLNGRDTGFVYLQLPDAFGFGKKPIQECIWIPVFRALRESWPADLALSQARDTREY